MNEEALVAAIEAARKEERSRCAAIVQAESMYWSSNESDNPDMVPIMIGAMGCGANILVAVLMGTPADEYAKAIEQRP